MTEKKKRHALILEMISKNKISSQKILSEKLEAKGMSVTQATLSRDLQELKIGRQHDATHGSVFVAALTSTPSVDLVSTLDTRSIQSAGFSGNLCVLKTQTGFANGIALRIDNMQIPEILGTIAGDDTILIIPKDKVNASKLKQVLIAFISDLKHVF